MARGGVSGVAVAEVGAGLIIAWAGIENRSITDTLKALIGGHLPAPGPPQQLLAPLPAGAGAVSSAEASAINPNPPNAATVAQYKAFALSLLTLHGWPTQWAAFSGVVGDESNWNPNARNPSGAYGIAQALGHGNANTAAPDGTNEYGGYGTPDAICRLANEGHGDAQLVWMCNYIAQAYGDPNAALASEQTRGFY